MIRQKGEGRSGVQRTPRFGAREQKIRSDEDTALSKLSPKDPKEIAKKFREWRGAAHLMGLSSITTRKAILQRPHVSAITQRSVADALRLKFFLNSVASTTHASLLSALSRLALSFLRSPHAAASTQLDTYLSPPFRIRFCFWGCALIFKD